MLKYIKENKSKIVATTTKVVAALIIPGGFIVWAAYELGKLKEQQRNQDDAEANVHNNTQNTSKSN